MYNTNLKRGLSNPDLVHFKRRAAFSLGTDEPFPFGSSEGSGLRLGMGLGSGRSVLPLTEKANGNIPAQTDEKIIIRPYAARREATEAISSNILQVLTDRNFCQVRKEDWTHGEAKKLNRKLFSIIKASVESKLPIRFATLYGVSSKGHVDNQDRQFLDVIYEYTVDKIEHLYLASSEVTFIIATPHAALNGVDKALRDNYAAELKELIESPRYGGHFKVDFLRPLWNQHGINEDLFLRIGEMVYDLNDDPTSINRLQKEIVREVLANIEGFAPPTVAGNGSHMTTAAQLAEEHVKRYFKNLGSLIFKFKQHRETVLSQSKHNAPQATMTEREVEIKARAYWLMRNCETNILTSSYVNSIFLTTSRLPPYIYPPLTLRFWPERYHIWHPWTAKAHQAEVLMQSSAEKAIIA